MEGEVPLFSFDLAAEVAAEGTVGDGSYVPAAANVMVATLEQVRSDLVALRGQRESINGAIKRLVAYEGYLVRIARIANEMLREEVTDDNEAAGAGQDVLDQ